MKLLTNLEMNKNQVLELVLQQLATAPTSPVKGQIYYNTTNDRVYVYDGTQWIVLDSKDINITAQNIVNTINSGESNINLSKIEGLNNALSEKITDAQAQAKADTALSNAKTFIRNEINKLVNGASDAYDTFKEIEDLLTNNANLNEAIKSGIANKTDKFVQIIGDNSATEYTINHNLNTQDVVVTVRENKAPFSVVLADFEITDPNSIKVKFAKSARLEEYKVIIIG